MESNLSCISYPMTKGTRLDPDIDFIDERKNNRLYLVSGMAMPTPIYQQADFFDELIVIIRENEIHWTNYGGHYAARNGIKHLMYKAMKYSTVLTMNVINYDQSTIKENSPAFSDVHTDLSEQTIYTKFPEMDTNKGAKDYCPFVN
ncbi:hypothetical protein [Salsuginibacillus kocurii]|uniref:hypothetical protein n=1 Tax=Salsuginibacillus kocurii TaxID=427078 RepID=UPI00037036CB|nr:hypothetical protein [Salsuginibacillus kocurii]